MFRKASAAAAAFALALFSASAAHAGITFVFQNPGADLPTDGNFTTGGFCNGVKISGPDLCTINDAAGLTYQKGGVIVNAVAYAGDVATSLIQDLSPRNSGLGALSAGETSSDDQIQSESNEWIEFTFSDVVTLTGIDFNAGSDTNCATPGSEGPCGLFTLIVDDVVVLMNAMALDDMVFAGIVGQVFRIIATGPDGAGFTIGSLTIADIPVPASAIVILTGLVGLGFAGRRSRKI